MEAGLPRAAERTEQTATGEPAFAMLLSETANLAKRERELTVARAELTGLREGRHTFLRAGQVFFRTPSETTKQAVTGHLAALEKRRREVTSEIDRISAMRELERQDHEDDEDSEEGEGFDPTEVDDAGGAK
mmetsp:Transcript_25347/g.59602  ORF Transcript_25347/g.59602 Transcript_25347/m.59602 type:complete len:132 (-) Transcript_25347:99-494(-)